MPHTEGHKTIGVGGSYTTLPAWEAAVNNTTYPTANTDVIAELIDAADYAGTGIAFFATNVDSFKVTVATGVRHSGVQAVSSGDHARIFSTTRNQARINDEEDTPAIYSWLDIDGRGADYDFSFRAHLLEIHPALTKATTVVDSCLVHDQTIIAPQLHGGGIRRGTGAGDIVIKNCAVYNFDNQETDPKITGDCVGITIGDAVSANIVYNTVSNIKAADSNGIGIRDFTTGTVICRNNVVRDTDSLDFSGMTAGNCSNNASSDFSAPGANSITSQSDGDLAFVSLTAGSEDFHITKNSSLKNAGTSVAGITVDIDGNTRPQGSAPDIGIHELLIAAVRRIFITD